MLTYADIRSRKRARAAKTLLMLVWTLVDKVLSLIAFTGTKVQILTQLEEQEREEVTYADVC